MAAATALASATSYAPGREICVPRLQFLVAEPLPILVTARLRPSSLVLIEPDAAQREILAERLRAQGYSVRAHRDPAEAISDCLAEPPTVVVANLWMPTISGVQLCRLLNSEAATCGVPVILRGSDAHPRNHFWADRAGAAAFVTKGRMGMLVRAIARAIEQSGDDADFFTDLADIDVRDRICEVLDKELHASLVAADVRALGSCETLPRRFDLLSQLVCQLTAYRWFALRIENPARVALHTHPQARESHQREVCQQLGIEASDVTWTFIEDEDASADASPLVPFEAKVHHAHDQQGQLLVSLLDEADEPSIELVARELGGPLRIVRLVEETQRLASHDPLTAAMNRRAFTASAQRHAARATRSGTPFCLLLLDIDHFKQVNDTYGHAAGDAVLRAVGRCAAETMRPSDVVARWGGEEFVVGLPDTDAQTGIVVAEGLCRAIAKLEVPVEGAVIRVTASIGVAMHRSDGTFDGLVERADKAMYAAKVGGRNRVMVDGARLADAPLPTSSLQAAAP